jgi:hypothetical protein
MVSQWVADWSVSMMDASFSLLKSTEKVFEAFLLRQTCFLDTIIAQGWMGIAFLG